MPRYDAHRPRFVPAFVPDSTNASSPAFVPDRKQPYMAVHMRAIVALLAAQSVGGWTANGRRCCTSMLHAAVLTAFCFAIATV